MIDNIIEHIRKAQLEAQKQHFKANIIIIDSDLAMINNFCPDYPRMIMGLEVKYIHNLTQDYGINFAIAEGDTMSNELISLRKENRELRRKLNKVKQVFESVGE